MEAEVLGIDHIYLAVRDLEVSDRFYRRALGEVLGFRRNAFTLAGDPHIQFFNRHFGVVLRPARGPEAPSGGAGLHHLCFRVEGAAEVERVAAGLQRAGIEATAPRLYPEYAPDYVATFFADPDGIRLEVTNFRAERRRRQANWEDPGGDDTGADSR